MKLEESGISQSDFDLAVYTYLDDLEGIEDIQDTVLTRDKGLVFLSVLDICRKKLIDNIYHNFDSVPEGGISAMIDFLENAIVSIYDEKIKTVMMHNVYKAYFAKKLKTFLLNNFDYFEVEFNGNCMTSFRMLVDKLILNLLCSIDISSDTEFYKNEVPVAYVFAIIEILYGSSFAFDLLSYLKKGFDNPKYLFISDVYKKYMMFYVKGMMASSSKNDYDLLEIVDPSLENNTYKLYMMRLYGAINSYIDIDVDKIETNKFLFRFINDIMQNRLDEARSNPIHYSIQDNDLVECFVNWSKEANQVVSSYNGGLRHYQDHIRWNWLLNNTNILLD